MGSCCSVLDVSNEDPYIIDNSPDGITKTPASGKPARKVVMWAPPSPTVSRGEYTSPAVNYESNYGIQSTRYNYNVSSSPTSMRYLLPAGSSLVSSDSYQLNMNHPSIVPWECTVPLASPSVSMVGSPTQEYIIPYCTPRVPSPIPVFQQFANSSVTNTGRASFGAPFWVPAPSPVFVQEQQAAPSHVVVRPAAYRPSGLLGFPSAPASPPSSPMSPSNTPLIAPSPLVAPSIEVEAVASNKDDAKASIGATVLSKPQPTSSPKLAASSPIHRTASPRCFRIPTPAPSPSASLEMSFPGSHRNLYKPVGGIRLPERVAS